MNLNKMLFLASATVFVVALVLALVGGMRDAVTVFALGGLALSAFGHVV